MRNARFWYLRSCMQQYDAGFVDALLHEEIPNPTPVFNRALYTSDFSSGTDGWSLNMQAGASGTLAASGGELNVSISSGGTEAWHSQLVKNDLLFEEGKLYCISFSGAAAANVALHFMQVKEVCHGALTAITMRLASPGNW